MRRPFLVPIICFLSGVTLCGSLTCEGSLKVGPLAGLLFAVLLISVFFRKRTVTFYVLICVFFFFLGAFRFNGFSAVPDNGISEYTSNIPRDVLLTGTVLTDPEVCETNRGRKTNFHIEAKRLLLNNEEISVTGRILVTFFALSEEPEIGDRIAAEGKLSRPGGRRNPAGFDYRKFLKDLGVRTVFVSSGDAHYIKIGERKTPVIELKRTIFRLRRGASRVLRKHLSKKNLPLLESVLLGKRTSLPEGKKELFIKTGTMHILAISGLHIGMIALLCAGILRLLRVPRDPAYILTALFISFYVIFSGSRPSAVRAALMSVFLMFGMAHGRRSDISSALALTAFLVAFFAPGEIFRPGFVLSYVAVLSIVYVTPFTDRLLNVPGISFAEKISVKMKRLLLKSVSLSLGIFMGIAPLAAYYFRIITPLVVVTNLVAVPVLFILLVSGLFLLATAVTEVFLPLTMVIAALIDVSSALLIFSLQMFSRIPFSFLRAPSPGWKGVCIYYILISSCFLFFASRNKNPLKRTVIAFLFACNFFAWNEISHGLIAGPTKMTFFATGKSDAIFIETGEGGTVLIDAGTGGERGGIDCGKDIIAPYLWQRGIRKIDCVIITHPHEDHSGGVKYLLENFTTGSVIDNGFEYEKEGKYYRDLMELIRKKRIDHFSVKKGAIIGGVPGVSFKVLNPPGGDVLADHNDSSLVLLAETTRGNTVLFCADTERNATKNIVSSCDKTDILKLPHHGQGKDNAEVVQMLVDHTEPSALVITNKRRKAVDKSLLRYFDDNELTYYITGISGAIIAEESNEGFKILEYSRKLPVDPEHAY